MQANVATKDGKNQSGNKFKGKAKFGKPAVVCQLCGKKNHVVSKCYKRFDKSFPDLDHNSQQNNQSVDNTIQANFAMHTQPPARSYYTPSDPLSSNY